MNALDAALGFQERAIKLASQREQLLASNIANADTPHYRARDLDFAQALAQAQGLANGQRPLGLRTSTEGHLQGARSADQVEPMDRPGLQVAADGNTVDMDQERTEFARNSVNYQVALTFLNGQIKSLLTAVQG